MTGQIFAVINAGTVTNTIKADEEFADIIRPDHQAVIDITSESPQPSIGWAWDGTSFSDPNQEEGE